MPKKLLRCLALLIVCVLGLAPDAPAAGAADPMQVITDAQKGIDAADDALFFEAVDADAVLNSAADAVITAAREEMRAGNLAADSAALALILSGLASGDAATVDMLKPVLLSEVKQLVVLGIRGGFFAGKPNGNVSADAALFSSALKSMSPERKELVPGRVLSQKENEAVISATLKDKGAGSFPLRLRLQRQNGGWQVKEILNANELAQKAVGKSR